MRGVPGRIWGYVPPWAELAPDSWPGCARSLKQARADLASGMPDGSSQGPGAAIWCRVTASPGRTRPGCTTRVFIPRSRSCRPCRELTKPMASAPKRPANFAQSRCGASPTCEPRPLAQAGQISRLRRWVPEPGTRPTWPYKTARHGVSRSAGQAGSQARHYAQTTPKPGNRDCVGHNLILPAEYLSA